MGKRRPRVSPTLTPKIGTTDRRILLICPHCGGKNCAALKTVNDLRVWHCFKCRMSGCWNTDLDRPL
jgi:hypothetical protein